MKRLKNFFKSDLFKLLKKYTFIFGLVACFIAYSFLKYHKGFIESIDGVTQHYVSLIYFKRILINFFTTGNLNTYTQTLNMGKDMFANLAYYCFGDIFSYLSIFVSESHMHILYYFLAILRMYFIGVFFIIYCKYKKMSDFSSLIGSITYTFCAFSVQFFFRHPYFINSIALFPLMILGIDRMILEDKKTFFSIIVGIAFISSFYFAYMMSICLAIYGIILIIDTYKDDGIKIIIKKILQVFLYAILGIGISCIILLPTIMQYLLGSRGVSNITYIYYPNYYRSLFSSLVSFEGANWVYIGINGLILAILPLVIKNYKNNKIYLLTLLILLVPLIIVKIGSIFCCFSYPSNRWTYVISFFLSFLIVRNLNDNKKLSKDDLIFSIIFITIYMFILLYFELNISSISLANFVAAFIFLILMSKQEKFISRKRYVNTFICAMVLTTCLSLFYIYDAAGNEKMKLSLGFNYPIKYYETNNDTIKKFKSAIEWIKEQDSDFYRIAKYPVGTWNSSLYYEYNSINGYHSINSSYIGNLGYDLSNGQYYTSKEISEFDNRTKITSLLSSKYFISDNTSYIPYGYEKVKIISNSKTSIYKNKYFVSYGTFYDSYIDEDEYEKLEDIEKEQSLLKTVALNNDDVNTKYVTKESNIKDKIKSISNVSYSIDGNIKNNKIIVDSNKDKKLTIHLDNPVNDGELYLKIKNLNYSAYDKDKLVKIYTKGSNDLYKKAIAKHNLRFYNKTNKFVINAIYGTNKKQKIFQDKSQYPYTSDTANYLVNFGYSNNNDDTIEINLSEYGEYSFDDIEVLLVNFDDYEEEINKLNQSNFEVTNYDDSIMEGTVNYNINGVLQFSTTYSKGYEVYVDNKKVDTFVSNKYFLGIYIDKGKHSIKIKYKTPYLKTGFCISILSCMLLVYLNYKNKKV